MGQSKKEEAMPVEDPQAKRKLSRNQLSKKINRELSCVAVDKASARVGNEADPTDNKKAQLARELAEHLRSIAPFNKRWEVTKTINEGTYGVVFAVKDVKTGVEGVIKVAKQMSSANSTCEFEGFILERIFRSMPSASIVRVLDKGMLADHHGNGMEFIVLEKAEIPVSEWIDSSANNKERRIRVCEVALHMLKGIADLHHLGLLHRDLKPQNMGIRSKDHPEILIFDLGMARMYTDGEGCLRPPRTTVPFRGTPEWASGHAAKGREQSRFDDLIAWLYVIVELFDKSDARQPLPWTAMNNAKTTALLKSSFVPARLLLRNCPSQFYCINAYLHTANRQKAPDYGFIADRVREATEEVKNKPDETPLNNTAASTSTAEKKKK